MNILYCSYFVSVVSIHVHVVKSSYCPINEAILVIFCGLIARYPCRINKFWEGLSPQAIQ